MSRATGRSGLRWWAALAILLLVLTVLLLPTRSVSKGWIIAVLVFAGVFTVLEAGSMGRALAALMIALLTLYLGVSFQRAWLLLGTEGWVPKLLGLAMVVIPAVGTWAMVREILFGARTARLGRELAARGELPADELPRTPSGRYVRAWPTRPAVTAAGPGAPCARRSPCTGGRTPRRRSRGPGGNLWA